MIVAERRETSYIPLRAASNLASCDTDPLLAGNQANEVGGRRLSTEIDTPVDENVFDACRYWLRYTHPDRQTYPVKVAQYRDVRGGEGNGGIYAPALREAQFHWALCCLDPFLAAVGLARRKFPRGNQVVYFIHQNYGIEWDGWRDEYPERPLRALLDHVAEAMARRLGSDIL